MLETIATHFTIMKLRDIAPSITTCINKHPFSHTTTQNCLNIAQTLIRIITIILTSTKEWLTAQYTITIMLLMDTRMPQVMAQFSTITITFQYHIMTVITTTMATPIIIITVYKQVE